MYESKSKDKKRKKAHEKIKAVLLLQRTVHVLLELQMRVFHMPGVHA